MGTNTKRPPQMKPVETRLPAAKPKPTSAVAQEKTTIRRPRISKYTTNSDHRPERDSTRCQEYICIQSLRETAQAELNRAEEEKKDLTSQNNISLAGYPAQCEPLSTACIIYYPWHMGMI